MGGDSGSSDSGGGFGPRQDFDPGLGVPSEPIVEAIIAGVPDPYTVQYQDSQPSGVAPTNVIRGGNIFTPGLYGRFPTAIPQAAPIGSLSHRIGAAPTVSRQNPIRFGAGSLMGSVIANLVLGGAPFIAEQALGFAMTPLGNRAADSLGIPNMLELSGSPLKGEVVAASPMFGIEPVSLFDDRDITEELMEDFDQELDEEHDILDEDENIISTEEDIRTMIDKARDHREFTLLREEGLK